MKKNHFVYLLCLGLLGLYSPLSGINKPDERWFTTASELFAIQQNQDNYYISLAKQADIADDEGDYKTAIRLARQAADHFIQQKDSNRVVRILNNLALYYYHQGEISQSISEYIATIAWAGNTNDAYKAMAYNQLGNIAADDLKDERKALNYYRKSLHLKLGTATPQSLSASYNNIGLSHKNLGDRDSALIYFQKALELAEESEVARARVNPLINIANHYKNQDKQAEAIKVYTQLLYLTESMTRKQLITLHTNLGIAYREMNSFSPAIHHLRIARDLSKDAGNASDLANIEQQLAYAYRNNGQTEKALEAMISYSSLRDSIHLKEKQQALADMIIRYESTEKDLQIQAQEKEIEQQSFTLQTRTLILITIILIILIVASFLFYLFKRKEAAERQARIELQLSEQKEITRIQEERLRISRELHDNIGSYLMLMSAMIEQTSECEEEANSPVLSKLKDAITVSMRELRKTVWLLNKQSIPLDEIGIRLRDFFKPLHTNGTRVQVITEGDTGQQLSEVQTTHLFRIIQEAVSNAYRYAEARMISIRLSINADKQLRISIEDDGKGFDINQLSHGNGLKNMQTRMKELSGELRIFSSPGVGTKIEGAIKL